MFKSETGKLYGCYVARVLDENNVLLWQSETLHTSSGTALRVAQNKADAMWNARRLRQQSSPYAGRQISEA